MSVQDHTRGSETVKDEGASGPTPGPYEGREGGDRDVGPSNS